MTGKERVQLALKGRKPNKIPYVEPLIDNSILTEHGGDDYTYFDFVEDMGLDGVVVYPNYSKKGCGWAGWESKIDEGVLKDKWGTLRKRGDSEYFSEVGGKDAPIESLEDLKNFTPPSVAKVDFNTLKEAVDRFKNKKAIIFRTRDVWSRPRALLGYKNMLTSTMTNKELVTKTIEVSLEFNKKVVERAVEYGAEIVWSSDDMADNNGLLIRPEIFRELFLPKFKEFVNHCKALGALYIKHSDGNIMEIIDDFVDAGVDCINPVEPYAGMSLRELRERYGSELALMGNVDCREVLTHGTEKEVEGEVKRAICEGAPGGGYIFSSSNSIHSDIPINNYMKMIQVWKNLRNYPLKGC